MWRLLQLVTYCLWIILREGVSFAITSLTKSEAQLVDRKSTPAEGENISELPATEAETFERCVARECEPAVSQEKAEEEKSESSVDCPDVSAKIGEEDDFILQLLHLPRTCLSEKASTPDLPLEAVVDQVRAAGHRHVRFSVEADHDPASIAVLGERSNVREACKALADEVTFDSKEEDRSTEHLFLVHFTMRETWDLPQDDELADASLGSDWIDLGREGDLSCPVLEDRADDATDLAQPSPQSVLRQRLREALAGQEDLYVFMDDDPVAPSPLGVVQVDFVGRLPSAWDSARRAILACEAHRVYLSHQFEVRFWPPPELRDSLQDQVKNAVSHCQDASESISHGGFGLVATGIPAYEVLADNISAILRGSSPPGWHRIEWTPHGTAAVPCHTY